MASQTHSSNATPTVMPTTTPTTTPTATPTITITHRTIHVRILEVSSGCCLGCCIGHGSGCGSRWGSQCGSGRSSGCVSILEWAKIWYFYGTWFGTWNWGMTTRPPKLLSRWTARYSHSFMIRCWTGPYVSADRQPDDRQTTSMTAGHYPDRVLDLFANVCPGTIQVELLSSQSNNF